MREYLFRGKRLDNGEWIYGAYLTIKHNDDDSHLHHAIMPIPLLEHPIGHVLEEVDPATVGQYTGLTDKNGKRIFKGDVLKLEDYHGERVVEVDYYGGVYYYCGDGFSDEYIFNSKDREITGNIHEAQR